MDNEVQNFIQASIQEGIQRALSNLSIRSNVSQGNSDSSDVEFDSLTFDTPSFEDGIEIPEQIFRWFPEVPSGGRLPGETYKKILEENPEPSRGVLKPPRLDRFLRQRLAKEIIKRDEILSAIHADTGRIVRPIISVACTSQADNAAFKKYRQSVLLAINTMAKITIQRKTSILRALKMEEEEVKYWCREPPTSREWLFGDELRDELETQNRKQYENSIAKIISERARTVNQQNTANNTTAYNASQHNQFYSRRGGFQSRGRGRGRGSYYRQNESSRPMSNHQGRAGPSEA
jgi:hypothetical protein